MKVAYIVDTYPSVSETFIHREIMALRDLGVEVRVFALRRPRGAAAASLGDVTYRSRVPGPGMLLGGLRMFLQGGGGSASPWTGLRRLRRQLTAFQFASVARTQGIDHVHAHFAYVTADIGILMGRLLGVKVTVSAHAWDIYTQSAEVLVPRLEAVSGVAVCTQQGLDRLASLVPGSTKLSLIRHGLDPERFIPGTVEEPRIVAVGRLTAKKGFGDLVDACALLAERGLEFSCSIVGGGREQDRLQRRITEKGLDGRVTLTGVLGMDAVVDLCRGASVFALPSVQTADGDRDGVPNAMLEAMALCVPVVTTTASAANEAIEDGVSGVLVPPGDAAALAAGIAELLGDTAYRKQLGDAGRAVVEQKFNLAQNAPALFRFLERCAGSQPIQSTGTL